MISNPSAPPRSKYNKIILHYWGRRGGGSLFTRLLATHLTHSGAASEVIFSLAQQNSDVEVFRATGLPIVMFDRPYLSTLWRKAWTLPQSLKAHADYLASLQPDAVIMAMNSPFAWPFIHALQRRGLRVVYVAHDAEPHPGDYAATWQRATQDLLVKRADKIVTLSRNVAKRLSERIPAVAGKISTIPLETVYPSKRTHPPDRPSSNDPIRLLFYGRLLPYKGLDLLAQALEPLKILPGWQLTIAGSGPLEAEVERAFSNWPQVHLELGWVSDQHTAELFSAHELLVCPYIEASQSGAVAEALSWAVPSLVMPTGALPEQIGCGTAGLVAEAVSADGLRRSLKSILGRPERLVELSRGAATLLAERHADPGWAELFQERPTPSTSRTCSWDV